MINDVLVTVRGQQKSQGETGNVIEVTVPGKHYLRDGCHNIMYEEINDEAHEITKNLVKFTSEKMEIRKKGYINSLMIFEPGKRTISKYYTPFGALDTGITTLHFKVMENEDSIRVYVKYAMTIDHDFVQDCEVSITIVPLKK